MKSFLLFLFLFLHFSLRAQADVEEVFTKIYDQAIWGTNENGKGFSGGGSKIENCMPYILYLEDFISVHNITSVVDAGCGDWTFSHVIDWKGATYLGLDVVKKVIDANIVSFSRPNVSFCHFDILKDSLPEADLLICKDVLQHLTLTEISKFLQQLHKFKHCLITNDVNHKTLTVKNNTEIQTGGYREIDLTKPPFNIRGAKVLTYRSGTNIKQVLHIENTLPTCNEKSDHAIK